MTTQPLRRGATCPARVRNAAAALLVWLALGLPRETFAQTAPVITSPPVSQSGLAGTNATFTVIATGSSPLSYHWLFNGTNLPGVYHVIGATNASLVVSNIAATNAGGYQVIVTNRRGSATSAVVTLTVLFPPAITNQPVSQTNLVGSSVTFIAAGSGTAPLSYRWKHAGTNLVNGGRISGATSAAFAVAGILTNDAGAYQLVVTNNYGSATSAVATLTVLVPTAIVTQPANQAALLGSNVVFSVAATGTGPLSYQWFFNGSPLVNTGRLSGALTATLTVSNVQLTDAGGYVVVVSNIVNAVTSSNATLTAVPVTHYVNVAGTNPVPPYANWSSAATNIQDAVDVANAGETVVVTNGIYPLGKRVVAGVTNRVAVMLPLLITSVNGPATTRIDGGGAARGLYLTNGCSLSGFTVTNGSSPQNGGGIFCETPNVVVTNCVLAGNFANLQGGGIYQGSLVNCTLTNNSANGNVSYLAGGAASSSVLQKCLVAGNSTDTGLGAGLFNCSAIQCVISNNSTFHNSAGGAYQSSLNNSLLVNNYAGSAGGGADACTLTNCTVVGNTGNYGPGGGIYVCTANNCIVYDNASPYIILFGGTPDQTNCANSIVNYSCTFPLMTNGVGNIINLPVFVNSTGDWHLQSNSPCINAGNNSYVIGAADLDGNPRIVGPTVDMGAYEYQAHTIAITAQPLSRAFPAGATVPFSVVAISPFPLGYRWYFNGTPLTDGGRISGSATANLGIQNFQTNNDVGAYQVVVTNIYGAVTSTVAMLWPIPMTHFVNVAGTNPVPPYATWNNAATNIQDAVDAANATDTILVTNGIYSLGNRVVAGVTNRVAVTIPLLIATVNGPATTWIDGGGAARCVYLTNGCSLSGFTVTNGTTPQNGGGIFCASTNVTITNCVLSGNSAAVQGGGIYQGSLVNCTLTGNSAAGNAQGYPGGGGASASVLNHCLLSGNFSTSYGSGGALFNCLANQCVLTNNSTPLSLAGGASQSTLNNCLLVNNNAGSLGGGADSCTLNNCTVAGNFANFGPGGGVNASVVNNCIVYNNTSALIILFGGTPDQTNCANSVVNYSCTYPLMTNGVGNITNLPLFVNPAGDWHLQSNSPCINAGNNSYITAGADLDGNPRTVGPTVDMGAYEYQAPTIAITAQPLSQALLVGTSVSFGVAAISPLPLGYRWYFNGTPLTDGGRVSGSATTNLSLLNLLTNDAGSYQCVVTNNFVSVTSAVATLTVLVPPTISTQPANQSVGMTSNTTFAAIAAGTAPLSYQWYFNGAPLTDGGRVSGSTTANLNLATLQPSDAGPYQLIVTNNYGSATSAVATLTVLVPASITLQPSNQLVLVTSNLLFAVTTAGTAPLNCQWFFNGSPLTDGGRVSGSATTNLFIANAQTNDAGLYQAVITNNFSSITSVVATLGVIAAPVITQPLTNQVTMVFSNVTLSLVVTAASPVYFQWQKDGTNLVNGGNLNGADSPNLTITNPQLTDSGQYTVLISNAWGTATSAETLTVVPIFTWGDSIVIPPAAATNVIAVTAAGNNLNTDFALRADGSVIGWGNNPYGVRDVPASATNVVEVVAGNLTLLALRQDGTVVSWGYGATAVPDNVTNIVAVAVEGLFGGCIALRQDGTLVTWNGATAPPASATNVIAIGAGVGAGAGDCLAVRQDGTVVGWGDNTYGETAPPASATNVLAGACGETHSLALRADGNVVGFGTSTPPANATNVVAIAAAKDHSVALRSDGTVVGWGIVGPSPAFLTNCIGISASYYHNVVNVPDSSVTLPPRIIQQPLSPVVRTNQTAILYSKVIGAFPLHYQWYFNDTLLAGQTNRWLLLSAIQAGQGGNYQLVVTNNFGSVTGQTTVVWTPPVILAQPSATVVFGSNASFSITAAGTPPFGYQWFFNGVPLTDGGRIQGSTGTNLTVANFQPSDFGNYTVAVTNLTGSITSTVAAITVLNPRISTQPQNKTAIGGATVSFSVTATGQQPLAYQWLFNGTNLDGATNNPLVLTNVLVSQTGTYAVLVSNIYSTVMSSNATLSVMALTITTQPTNRVAWLGGYATFRVNVSGVAPFTFEWQCNNVDVPGVFTNVLTLTNVQPAQFGNYSVIVGNAYGSISSTNANLSLSQVAVWGYGANGETNVVAGLTNLVAISASSLSSRSDCLALNSDGGIVAWPFGPATPVKTAITNLVAIGCGGGNGPNLGLRSDGRVISWFFDSPSFVPGLSNIVAIASVNYTYLALKTNGSLANLSVQVGGPPPAVVTNLTGVVAIAEGYSHSLALTTNGTVNAWGSNTYGQTNVPPGLSNLTAIAAGGYHNLALKADGTIVAWGRNLEHQTNVPPGLSNVVAIAAGGYHNLALKNDGSVVAWGLNTYGQTNVPATLTNIIAIAAGEYHSLALIGNGPPVMHVSLASPSLNSSNSFSFSLPTHSGKVYVLQYKNSLTDANWTALPLVPGNGGTILLTDPAATNFQRFYQVQQW